MEFESSAKPRSRLSIALDADDSDVFDFVNRISQNPNIDPRVLATLSRALGSYGEYELIDRIAKNRPDFVGQLRDLSPSLYLEVQNLLKERDYYRSLGEAYSIGRSEGEARAARGETFSGIAEAAFRGTQGFLGGIAEFFSPNTLEEAAKNLDDFSSIESARRKAQEKLASLSSRLESISDPSERNNAAVEIGKLRAALADDKALADYAAQEYEKNLKIIQDRAISFARQGGEREGFKESSGRLTSLAAAVAEQAPSVAPLIAGSAATLPARASAAAVSAAVGGILSIVSGYEQEKSSRLVDLINSGVDPKAAVNAARRAALASATVETLLGTVPFGGAASSVAKRALASGVQEAAQETAGEIAAEAAERGKLLSELESGNVKAERYLATKEREQSPIQPPDAESILASGILGGAVGAIMPRLSRRQPTQPKTPQLEQEVRQDRGAEVQEAQPAQPEQTVVQPEPEVTAEVPQTMEPTAAELTATPEETITPDDTQTKIPLPEVKEQAQTDAIRDEATSIEVAPKEDQIQPIEARDTDAEVATIAQQAVPEEAQQPVAQEAQVEAQAIETAPKREEATVDQIEPKVFSAVSEESIKNFTVTKESDFIAESVRKTKKKDGAEQEAKAYLNPAYFEQAKSEIDLYKERTSSKNAELRLADREAVTEVSFKFKDVHPDVVVFGDTDSTLFTIVPSDKRGNIPVKNEVATSVAVLGQAADGIVTKARAQEDPQASKPYRSLVELVTASYADALRETKSADNIRADFVSTAKAVREPRDHQSFHQKVFSKVVKRKAIDYNDLSNDILSNPAGFASLLYNLKSNEKLREAFYNKFAVNLSNSIKKNKTLEPRKAMLDLAEAMINQLNPEDNLVNKKTISYVLDRIELARGAKNAKFHDYVKVFWNSLFSSMDRSKRLQIKPQKRIVDTKKADEDSPEAKLERLVREAEEKAGKEKSPIVVSHAPVGTRIRPLDKIDQQPTAEEKQRNESRGILPRLASKIAEKVPEKVVERAKPFAKLLSPAGGLPKELRDILTAFTRSRSQQDLLVSNAISVLNSHLEGIKEKEGPKAYSEVNRLLKEFIAGPDEKTRELSRIELTRAFERMNRPEAANAVLRLADARRRLALEIVKLLGTNALKLGTKVSEDTFKLLQTIYNNKDNYIHRSYLAFEIPRFLGTRKAKEYFENFLKVAREKPHSVEGQIYNNAIQVILENNLLMGKDMLDMLLLTAKEAPDGAAKAEAERKLADLYSIWVNPAAKNLDLDAMYRDLVRIAENDEFIEKAITKAEETVRSLLGLEQATQLSRKIISSLPGGLSALLEKKNVPEQIRKLLGEITNPVVQIASTLAEQINVLSRVRFTSTIFEIGRGIFWETPDNQGKTAPNGETFSIQLDGWQYGSLNGMYVTKELHDIINSLDVVNSNLDTFLKALYLDRADIAGSIVASKLMRGLSKASAAGKIITIATSIPAWIMNATGSVISVIMNGNYDPKSIGSYFKNYPSLVKQIVTILGSSFEENKVLDTNKFDPVLVSILDNAQTQELFEAGKNTIVQPIREQVNKKISVFNQLFDKATAARIIEKQSKARKAFRKLKMGVLSMYSSMDLAAKLFNYFREVEFLKNVYELEAKAHGKEMTKDDLEKISQLALVRTNHANFSYHLAPPIVRWVEKSGATWFLTYTAETIRAPLANIRLALEDMDSAKEMKSKKARDMLMSQARKRLIGASMSIVAAEAMLAAVLGLTASAISSGLSAAFDDGEEDEKDRERAIRLMAASKIIEHDTGGSPVVDFGGLLISTGRINPIGPMTSVARGILSAAATGDTDSLKRAADEIFSVGGALQLVGAYTGLTTARTARMTGESITPNAARRIREHLSRTGLDPRTANLVVNTISMFTPRIVTNPLFYAIEKQTPPEFSLGSDFSTSATLWYLLGGSVPQNDFYARIIGAGNNVSNALSNSASSIWNQYVTGPSLSDSQKQDRERKVAEIMIDSVDSVIKELKLARDIHNIIRLDPKSRDRFYTALSSGAGKNTAGYLMRALAIKDDKKFEETVAKIVSSWLVKPEIYVDRIKNEANRSGNPEYYRIGMNAMPELARALSSAKKAIFEVYKSETGGSQQ